LFLDDPSEIVEREAAAVRVSHLFPERERLSQLPPRGREVTQGQQRETDVVAREGLAEAVSDRLGQRERPLVEGEGFSISSDLPGEVPGGWKAEREARALRQRPEELDRPIERGERAHRLAHARVAVAEAVPGPRLGEPVSDRFGDGECLAVEIEGLLE